MLVGVLVREMSDDCLDLLGVVVVRILDVAFRSEDTVGGRRAIP